MRIKKGRGREGRERERGREKGGRRKLQDEERCVVLKGIALGEYKLVNGLHTYRGGEREKKRC